MQFARRIPDGAEVLGVRIRGDPLGLGAADGAGRAGVTLPEDVVGNHPERVVHPG